jgi:hypothetical protein
VQQKFLDLGLLQEAPLLESSELLAAARESLGVAVAAL